MKKRIKETIQLLILALSCYNGLFFSYAFVWFCFDLPATWWAMLGLSLLAVASLHGLYKWIDSNKPDLEGE